MPEKILEDINYSAQSLLSSTDIKERYKVIGKEAARILNVKYSSIFLGSENKLIRVYSNVPMGRRETPRRHGYAYKTFRTGQINVVLPDEIKSAHPDLYKKGIRCLILIPLAVENERLGLIALQDENPRNFRIVELQALKLFGSLATLAIRNSQFIDEIKKSIESRDLFISLASHELRTPITTISVYIDQISKKLNSKQIPTESSMTILHSEVKRLKNIVNDLLEFDRITSGQFHYRWQELNIITVLKKSMINFRATNPSYKLLLENNMSKGESIIQGDPEKLQQAFSNILINAAKFSSSFTPIVILVERIKDRILISFSDFGKGIKKADQVKVFKEFYKAEGNRQKGMGIGLYLVKRIIERHKGEISIYSKLHKGTTITIELPTKLYES